MSRFNFPSSLDQLQEDAVLEHTGLRFRASFGAYARLCGRRELQRGDRVRLFVDPERQRIGLKRVRTQGSSDRGLAVVTPYGGAAPMINNVRLTRVISQAIGSSEEAAKWSLCEPVGADDVDFCLTPTPRAKRTIAEVLSSLDRIAERAGFRPSQNKRERYFMGERDTVILDSGVLTAMRCGRERGSLRVCVPFVSASGIERWFTELAAS